jgi:pimeloyl-ACP methyl ester carboxylesterase
MPSSLTTAPRFVRTRLLGLAIAAGACAPAPRSGPASTAAARQRLDIQGHQIWAPKEGAGDLTVAFESGFGNDSTVWARLTPRVRPAGVQTFVYDRAGLGQSTLNEAVSFSLDNDAVILKAALTQAGITGPVVMVGHSYGGAISLVAAESDERIRGVVLIDAVVPGVWPKHELETTMRAMRADYDQLRKEAPALAKVAIPFGEALPATARRLDAVRVSDALPLIDIVAERGQNSPESTQLWRAAHAALTADRPRREAILAVGSSHKVMVDRPDLVVGAILKMIEQVRGANEASAPGPAHEAG